MLCVRSEFDPLLTVVVASPRHFRPILPVNATQERFFADGRGVPTAERLVEEHLRVVEAMRQSRDVTVLWAPEIPTAPLQVNVRDVGAVVGSSFIRARMRLDIRGGEPVALDSLLDDLDARVLELDDGFFEGGDLLCDGERVFVGIGERTSDAGVRALAAALPDVNVISVRLASRVLHLDVAMTLLPGAVALAHRRSIVGFPDDVANRYDVIEITDDEQQRLATNVFALDEQTVLVDARNERVARILRCRGLTVVALEVPELTKLGGSFRCMTLPLVRRGLE